MNIVLEQVEVSYNVDCWYVPNGDECLLLDPKLQITNGLKFVDVLLEGFNIFDANSHVSAYI
jgi:hypothetical protein